MIKNIRRYFKKQNQIGNYIWLREMYYFLLNLWEYYPFRRFLNFLHFFFLVNIKGQPPLKIDKKISNGVFYVCLAKSGNQIWVVKIPHLNKPCSVNLYKKIKNKRNFIEYSSTIKSLSADPILGKHFPPVREVKRNGGYSSLYIEGYNLLLLLDDLRFGRNLPQDIESSDLIKAINELLNSLSKFGQQNGCIYGDWTLDNLLYDRLNKKIKNVDLEGYYMYRQDQPSADMRYIKAILESLIETLEMRQRNQLKDEKVLNVSSVTG